MAFDPEFLRSLPFLTAYAPAVVAADSVDPLGSLRAYVALAELLLPGVITVTVRARYLSMVCAALALVEEYGETGVEAALRRRATCPYERLWALACMHAKNHLGVEK
ncbi:hypothetical protein WME91_27265 [Sorangium sp. So ce269]